MHNIYHTRLMKAQLAGFLRSHFIKPTISNAWICRIENRFKVKMYFWLENNIQHDFREIQSHFWYVANIVLKHSSANYFSLKPVQSVSCLNHTKERVTLLAPTELILWKQTLVWEKAEVYRILKERKRLLITVLTFLYFCIDTMLNQNLA